MPQALKPDRATLQEIWWDNQGKSKDSDPKGVPTRPFEVQFNPQTLKVNYSNQAAGGDQPKGAAVQFVGKGTTKLSVELLFDTTSKETSGSESDVRELTDKVNAFMRPKKVMVEGKEMFVPAGVRFQWGAFLFEGVMDSMDETLELFSEKGVPLRATVSISLSQQDIQFKRRDLGLGGGLPGAGGLAGGGGLPGGTPGTEALNTARGGESYQQMASKAGVSDWKPSALANGIEDPRRIAAGTLVNVKSASDAGRRAAGNLGIGL